MLLLSFLPVLVVLFLIGRHFSSDLGGVMEVPHYLDTEKTKTAYSQQHLEIPQIELSVFLNSLKFLFAT